MNEKGMGSREKGFGAYLRGGRIKAGLSFDEIAGKLFLPAKTLKNLEEENHSELLEPVYVLGFVKSYADFLGLRVEKALLLYRESHRRWKAREEDIRRRARRKKYVRAWLGGGLATFLLIFLFTLLGLGLIHVFVLDKKVQEKEVAQTEKAFTEKKIAVQRRIRLDVFFSESSSLKIMIDGNHPQSFIMGPGERLEFDAEKTYNIMIGNAAGVRLFLNGNHVPVSGTPGQAVSLFLP